MYTTLGSKIRSYAYIFFTVESSNAPTMYNLTRTIVLPKLLTFSLACFILNFLAFKFLNSIQHYPCYHVEAEAQYEWFGIL